MHEDINMYYEFRFLFEQYSNFLIYVYIIKYNYQRQIAYANQINACYNYGIYAATCYYKLYNIKFNSL